MIEWARTITTIGAVSTLWQDVIVKQDSKFWGSVFFVRRVFNCFVAVLVLSGINGCGESGPPSIDTTSSEIPGLSERVQIVEQYVNFDREYLQLEFKIFYKNNGGFLPAPSDWDIQLVAVVPKDQIDDWLSHEMTSVEAAKWADGVASEIDVSDVNHWVRKGDKVVGIDRSNSIVVYRHNTFGE